MELWNWWKRWKRGDAVCKVANVDSLNRVYNVLESIEAIGLNGIDAQINKPIDADGRGWTITIDGNPLMQMIEDDNGPMPFDLAIRGGYPCVYVPITDENLVYVRGMGNEAVRDASATPTQDQDGWRQLPSGTGPVWVWVRWDHTTLAYRWGIATSDPMQGVSAQDRYLLSMLIGGFDGDDTEVVAQYYHGDIVVADDNGDDLSVERLLYRDVLSLHAFQAGAHTSEAWDDVDILVREERSGSHPHEPYELNYISGADLKQEIYTYVTSIVHTIVETAISDFLSELIIGFGGSGSGDSVSDLVDALDARYQPICTSSEPVFGVGNGQWTGNGLPSALAATISQLEARITALENA